MLKHNGKWCLPCILITVWLVVLTVVTILVISS